MISETGAFPLFSAPAHNPDSKEQEAFARSLDPILFQHDVMNDMLPQGNWGKLLIDFAVRTRLLQETVKEGDLPYLKKLASFGVDIKALDEEGNSLLALVPNSKPELFSWLLEQEIGYASSNSETLLGFILNKIKSTVGEDQSAWELILAELLYKEKYYFAEGYEPENLVYKYRAQLIQEFVNPARLTEHIYTLSKIVGKNDKLDNALLICFKELIEQNLDLGIKIATRAIFWADRWPHALEALYKEKVFTDRQFERLLQEPHFLVTVIENYIFYKKNVLSSFFDNILRADIFPGIYWKPSEELSSYMKECSHPLTALFCSAFMETTQLSDAAILLEVIRHLPEEPPQNLQRYLILHVKNLEKKEQTIVWRYYPNSANTRSLEIFKKWGFPFDAIDKATGRTVLFYPTILSALAEESKQKNPLIPNDLISHRDCKGNNALEHCCLQEDNYASKYIDVLCQLGVQIETLPQTGLCRATFPDQPKMQAKLAVCLLHPNNPRIISSLLHYMDSSAYIEFSKQIKRNLSLNKRLGKYLDKFEGSSPTGGLERIVRDSKNDNWQSKLSLNDRSLLSQRLYLEPPILRYELKLLLDHWEKEVPSDALKKIPGLPLPSLLLSALEMQGKSSKRKKVELIRFLDLLTSSESLHFNRWLIEHPELMQVCVRDYMKIDTLDIKSGGGIGSNFGELAAAFSGQVRSLKTTKPDISWDLALNCGPTLKPSRVISELKPPKDEDCSLSWHDSTLIFKRKTGEVEGFRFLKRKEPYKAFSTKYKTAEIFSRLGDQFKSKMIKPLGIYIFEKLEDSIAKSHAAIVGKELFIAIRFQGTIRNFIGLKNLPGELFNDAFKSALHDVIKLVKMGFSPTLLPGFNSKKCPYTLLPFVVNSSEDSSTRGPKSIVHDSFHSPALTASGLNNFLDIPSIDQTVSTFGLRYDSSTGFVSYQAHTLANILLIFMITLVERHHKLSLEEIGTELGRCFAEMAHAYTTMPLQRAQDLSFGCGIDLTRLASQFLFWTSPKSYFVKTRHSKDSKNLYEECTDLWISEKALSLSNIKGNHIGPKNGPLPLTEFIKLVHLLPNVVLYAKEEGKSDF